eukprot:909653-Pyramimonas_sp.AAC.1
MGQARQQLEEAAPRVRPSGSNASAPQEWSAPLTPAAYFSGDRAVAHAEGGSADGAMENAADP